ncbi:dTMP kinase [Polaromonas hydrogenivorans]|uniref:Thymidylate kinase n=1 Tax=Polaromonas hydrogenivorans TaxID=335476 RepID=A0AAU7LL63_9BURK
MTHHGLFISFEGIDGAGKSTHIAGLADAFQSEGRAVTLTREPGGTLLAEKLRNMVLDDAMDPLTESLLIFAARRDHLVRVIAPALLRGDVVLCDRFTDATFAYQGAGRGFDVKVLATLERWVQSDEGLLGDPTGNQPMKPEVETVIEPHLTVWFDLPPEEAALRLADSRVPDRFESQPVEFFRRVARGYAERQLGHPERFARIDASQNREAVWQGIRQVFVEKGWLQAAALP